MKSKDRKRFSHRIDMWDDDGENVLEHLAGVEDSCSHRRSHARSADRCGWFQSHTREKALMLNFVEMNLSKAASE